MSEIATLFLEHGLLGACVVVLAITVWRLHSANTKVQETRVAEAQAVTEKLLEVSEKFIDQVSVQTAEVGRSCAKIDGVERKVDGVLAAQERHALDTARRGR